MLQILYMGFKTAKDYPTVSSSYEWDTSIHCLKEVVDTFCESLLASASEGEYRLLAITELARIHANNQIATVAVTELFHVAFLHSAACRDAFYKPVLDMIATIINSKITLTSTVMELINSHYEFIGSVSIGLLKRVPLDIWRPSSYDFTIVIGWINAVEDNSKRELSQYVLDSLSWGVQCENKSGLLDQLFLSSSIFHVGAALAIIGALSKVEKIHNIHGVGLGSMLKTVAKAAGASFQIDEFASWCWQRLIMFSFRNDYCEFWEPDSASFVLVNDNIRLSWMGIQAATIENNSVLSRGLCRSYASNAVVLGGSANLTESDCLCAFFVANATDYVQQYDWLPLYVLIVNNKFDAALQSLFNIVPNAVKLQRRNKSHMKYQCLPTLDSLQAHKDYQTCLVMFKNGKLRAPSSLQLLNKIGDMRRRHIISDDDGAVLTRIILSTAHTAPAVFHYCLFELELRLNAVLEQISDSDMNLYYPVVSFLDELVEREASNMYVTGIWSLINSVRYATSSSPSTGLNAIVRIADLLEAHIIINCQQYAADAISSAAIADMWMIEIQKKCSWEHDANYRLVVDSLIKASFTVARYDDLASFNAIARLLDGQLSLLQFESSINSNFYPTLLPINNTRFWDKKDHAYVVTQCPYLSFAALLVETTREYPLWSALGIVMASHLLSSIDKLRDSHALTRDLMILGFSTSTPTSAGKYGHTGYEHLSQFRIYRWVAYILALDPGEVLTPLYWQMFFILYFSKTPSVGASSSVFFGYKFLTREDTARTRRKGMLPELMEKLKSLASYCQEEADKSRLQGDDTDQHQVTVLYYKNLASLYISMASWINEGDPSIWLTADKLSSMPANFDVARLVSLLHSPLFKSMTDISYVGEFWMDTMPPLLFDHAYMKAQSWISHRRATMLAMEKGHCGRKMQEVALVPLQKSSLFGDGSTNKLPLTYTHLRPLIQLEITLVLSTEGVGVPAMYSIPLANVTSLLDILYSASIAFSDRVSMNAAQTLELIDLAQDLYTVEAQRRVFNKKCKLGNKCGGEAAVELKWTAMKLNPEKEIQSNKAVLELANGNKSLVLFSRRDQYEDIVRKDRTSTNTSSLNEYLVALLTIVSLSNELIRIYTAHGTPSSIRVTVSYEATSLFHTLVNHIGTSTMAHPSTHMFLIRVTKHLGSIFIQGNASETGKLLLQIVKEKDKTGLLSHLFNPKGVPNDIFDLYQVATQSLSLMDDKTQITVFSKLDIKLWLSTNPTADKVKDMIRLCFTSLRASINNSNEADDRRGCGVLVDVHLKSIEAVTSYSLPSTIIYIVEGILGLPCGCHSVLRSLWKHLSALPPASWEGLTNDIVMKVVSMMSQFITQYRLTQGHSPLQKWYEGDILMAFFDVSNRLLHIPALWSGVIPLDVGSRYDRACSLMNTIYTPWFSTINRDGANSHCPWQIEQVESATLIVTRFANDIVYCNELFRYDGSMLEFLWQYYITTIYQTSNHAVDPHVSQLFEGVITVIIPWKYWRVSWSDLLRLNSIMKEPCFDYIPLQLCHCILTNVNWNGVPTISNQSLYYSTLLETVLHVLCTPSLDSSQREQLIASMSNPGPPWHLIIPNDYESALASSVAAINKYLTSTMTRKLTISEAREDDAVIKYALTLLEAASDLGVVKNIVEGKCNVDLSMRTRISSALERYSMFAAYIRSPVANVAKIRSSISNSTLSTITLPRLPLTPISYACLINKGLELTSMSERALTTLSAIDNDSCRNHLKMLVREWLEFLNIPGLYLLPLPPGVEIMESSLLSWQHVEKSLMLQFKEQQRGSLMATEDNNDAGGVLLLSTFTAIGATFKAFISRSDNLSKVVINEAAATLKTSQARMHVYEGAIMAFVVASPGNTLHQLLEHIPIDADLSLMSLLIDEASQSGCYLYVYLILTQSITIVHVSGVPSSALLASVKICARAILDGKVPLGAELKLMVIINVYMDSTCRVLSIIANKEGLKTAEDDATLVEVKHVLLQVADKLGVYGDDRISAGLLAWVGLGVKSQYQVEFRLMCR